MNLNVMQRAKRKVLIILFALLPSLAGAISYTWHATNGNGWGDPENWLPIGIPGPGDDVTIDAHISAGSQSFNSLTINGGSVTLGDLSTTILNINGGALNVSSASMDTFNLTDGSLNATQAGAQTVSLNPSGVWTWTGGSVTAPNGITIPSSAALNFPGGVGLLGANTTLNNAGTATLNGGQLQFYDHSVFNNQVGASCTITSNIPFTRYHNSANAFNNDGLLESNAPEVLLQAIAYNLNAETRVTSGTLKLQSTINIADGASFTGAGTTRFEVDTYINGSADITAGTVVHAAGNLTGTASGQFVGDLSWTGGVISSNLNIPNGSSLTLSGPDLKELNTLTTIDNHGTMTWQGGGKLRPYDRGTIINHTDGVFEIGADGEPFSHYFYGHVFQNNGLFTKNGGSGGIANLLDLTFNMDGELNCTNGTIRIDGAANFPANSTITGSGEVTFNGDVNITGACTETIDSLRFIGGTITGTAPGAFVGTLVWEEGTITGTLGVPAGSLLEMTGPGTMYLNTDAVLNVDGTLQWKGSGPLRGWDRSIVNIGATGVFDITADGPVLEDYHATNMLNITGRLVKTGGTGTSNLQYWTIHVEGEISAESGTIDLSGINHLDTGCWFSGTGSVEIGGTTSLNGATTCTPQVSVVSGTFTGDGGTLNGDIHWSGGSMIGTVVVGPTGHLMIDGPAVKYLAGSSVIQVDGLVDFTEGDLQGYDLSRIEVRNGGVFNVEGTPRLAYYFNTNTLEVQAGGSFTASTGADHDIVGWAVDNHGTFTVENGATVDCTFGGHSSGTFIAESGGLLNFAGGDHYLQAGGTTSGPGEVRVSSGALLADDTTVDAFVHVLGGRVGSSGLSGNFRFKDGSSWTYGALSDTLTIPSGATLINDGTTGNRELWTNAVLTNEGILRCENGGPIRGNENVTLINASSGRIEFQADGSAFINFFTGNVLENHGTIEKMAGSGNTELRHWSYTNDGTLKASSGTLLVVATLGLDDGGAVEGPERVKLLGGTTTVNGTTTVSGGTLELGGAEIKGHANGTGILAGNLIEWTGGYTSAVLTFGGTVKTAGSSTKLLGGSNELRIAGTMTVEGTGALQCYENSTLKVLSSGTLHLTGSNSLTNYFSGTNVLRNEGAVELGTTSPAVVSLPWTYEQTATGTLVVDIAGSDPSTEFDRLLVYSAASLNGTVTPRLTGGYEPPTGTEFDILTTTGGLGTTAFSGVNSSRFSMADDDLKVTLTALAVLYDYDTWATEKGLTGPDALKSANPDGDKLTNFGEYAFNTNPLVPDVPDMTVGLSDLDSQRWLVLRYRVWQNRVDAGVIYDSERSDDLQTWDQNGLIDEVDPDASTVPGTEPRRARIQLGSGKGFLQVVASQPDT